MAKKLKKVKTPLKGPGSKNYLAGLIAANSPPHKHFVEPFALSAAVLFATTTGDRSEVISDLDKQVSNFWKVLQSEDLFRGFARQVQAIPFSEVECGVDFVDLRATDVMVSPSVDAAVRFFVRTRQTYCGIGKSFAPLSKNRTRTGINEQASAWLTSVERLPEIHRRLIPVVVRCGDFEQVIKSEDSENTWYYLDPPYWVDGDDPVTEGLYRNVMTKEDHVRMLVLANAVRGKVMISGYDNDLYRLHLKEPKWRRIEVAKASAMTKADEKPKRIEVLWCNY